MKDQDTNNEAILENIEADFDSFLARQEFSNCEAVIDNLRDMKKFEKGIELAKRLAAARMRVPTDYGFQKKPAFQVYQETHAALADLVRGSDETIF